MQAQRARRVLDRLAVRQRLQVDLVAEPRAQHAFGRRRGEIVAVAAARVVGVRVRDDGAVDRPPRVDVEIARRAVQAFAALHDQVVAAFAHARRTISSGGASRTARSASRCRRARRGSRAGTAGCCSSPSRPACRRCAPPRAGGRAARRRSASSRTKTLASRASSRLSGSRFDEPTVAIAPCAPSITATLACRKLGAYSMISMPARAARRTSPGWCGAA